MRISTILTVWVFELIAISTCLTGGFSPRQGNRSGRTVGVSPSSVVGPCSILNRRHQNHHVRLHAEQTESDGSAVATATKQVQEIGLLTFDLDDTLYPIAPVVEDANGEVSCCRVIRDHDVVSDGLRRCWDTNLVLQAFGLSHFPAPFLTIDYKNHIAAFVKAMERYGFDGVDAFDIVSTGKEVREELAITDPEKAAAL
jgi:hypothetical protein